MKFTVEQSALADGVSWVSRSLSSRPIMTALLGIVISTEGNTIHLTGSDLETTSKSHFDADVKDAGEVLVPGRLLAEISRSLPNKPVTFTLDGTRVLVTAGSAKFTLPTLPLNEYPQVRDVPEIDGTVASDLFATAVSQVAVAAGRDESLPTLTGIHVEVKQDSVTLAATDRYRLAVREFSWQAVKPNTETSALLRARTLADAAKSIAGSKNVSISFGSTSTNDRLAGFVGDGKTMTSRMLDGTFPPYQHLLPQSFTTTAVIKVEPLLASVRRVALVTDKTVPLRLNFANNKLSLEAGTGEDAQATEELDISLDGEAITIAFNPGFLEDGLQAVGTEFVQIAFTGSNKPAVLTGKSSADGASDESYRYLLMPMRYAS